MEQRLSKSADTVQNALKQHELECKVHELPTSTRTANDAAASIGCDIAQIVKSLIFKTKYTNKPVLMLVSGANKVNEKKIKAELNESITKADAEFVRNMTGFAIGGIPPIGHKNKLDLIFIDKDLTTHNEVWAAAGTPNAVFCIKSSELVNITKGKVIKI